MIIDCHCHAGRGDGLTGPWDTNASLEKYLRRASRAGIDRTVLFAAFHSDYTLANQEVARIVNSRPDRFYGFAFVNPQRDRSRIRMMVEEAVTRYGFVGIKVHRHDASITREVCETARAFSLPVLYDVVGEVSVVELLAQEYPDVTFIIPHLGSFADDWRAQLGLIDHLVRHRISIRTLPECAVSICSNRQCTGPARRRFSLAPMGHGCTPQSSWQK